MDRTTLLDNPQTRTLLNPERHSVHCLVDVKQCRESGYEMISLGPISDNMHGRAYRFESSQDNDKIVEFARSKSERGYCTTCTGGPGNFTNGFKAVVHGTVKSDASGFRPAIMSIDDIFDSGTFCPSGFIVQPSVYVFESNFNSFIYAHASMMIIGWGTLLPLGVIIANLGRHRPNGLWFKIHRPLQIIGLTFALVGWIIALTQFTALDHGKGDNNIHASLGMLVMCAGLAQPLNAFIRPHIEEGEKKTTKRVVWEFVHKSFGYGSVFLAVVVISFGTKILPKPEDRNSFRLAYGIGSGTVLFSAILFLIIDKYRFKNRPAEVVEQQDAEAADVEEVTADEEEENATS